MKIRSGADKKNDEAFQHLCLIGKVFLLLINEKI